MERSLKLVVIVVVFSAIGFVLAKGIQTNVMSKSTDTEQIDSTVVISTLDTDTTLAPYFSRV